MKLELLYQLEKFDSKGRKIFSSTLQPCDSFVLQFLQMIEICLRNVDNFQVKDVGGTLQNVDAPDPETSQYHMWADAGPGDDSFGIVVGTGTTSPVSDDYQLEAKIAHGIGSGQLEYQDTAWTSAYDTGSGCDFQIRRTFHNDSGATITVREIGLFAKSSDHAPLNTWVFLLIRDAVNQAVANNETLSVKFTLRTQV